MDRATKKLLFACRNGNVAWATDALAAEAQLTATDADGLPAIVVAASNGHETIVIKLLEAGAEPSGAADAAHGAGHIELARAIRDWKPVAETVGDHIWDREWALCKAVDKGDLAAAKALLEKDIDPNAATQPVFPMAAAARDGNLAMMRLLNEHFSSFERPKMKPPISWAIWSGKIDAIRLLIEWGANVDAADGSGTTPMHEAAEQGRADIAAILFEAGASPNLSDKFGNTPLTLAVKRSKSLPFVELLIRKHQVRVPPGLLSDVCRFGKEEDLPMLALLVEGGADVEERVDGRSVIEQLALRAQTALVDELVRLGANREAILADASHRTESSRDGSSLEDDFDLDPDAYHPDFDDFD